MVLLFAWYVALAQRRAGALCCGFLAVAALALSLALGLELRTDMTELLPPDHPAVRALRQISGHQKSSTNLVVLISSPARDLNRGFAEALRPALQRLIPGTLTSIEWRPDPEIPDFARRWRWLYADLQELSAAEELLDRVLALRHSPLAVDLDGDPEADLRALRRRLEARLPPALDVPYFEREDRAAHRHYLGIMLWRSRDGLASQGDRQLRESVQALVASLGPARFHPALRVEYTGHIGQVLDEQDGIREDLLVATVLCSSLVFLAIYLYFRRVALILVVGAPALLGLLLALALAQLTLRYLNLNTAFLISIILGNGINAPIVLLARYGEERRSGRAVPESLSAALSTSFTGTLTAMLAASVAYGSLLLTRFRGFSQFGLIGGAGMLLVWLATFSLVPPLLILGERAIPGRLTPGTNLWRRPLAWFGRVAERRTRWLLVAVTTMVLLAAPPLWRYARSPIEWDMDRLRTDDAPAMRLWDLMTQLGMGQVGAGYIGNDAVFLVNRPEQAEVVAEVARRQDRALGRMHVLKEVRTLRSVLPQDQDQKLAILVRLRGKIDRYRQRLGAEAQQEAQQWRPPEWLRPLVAADLPRQVREAFTEVDGQLGRLIGVDADPETYSNSNGHDLMRLSRALTVQSQGQTWVAASAATIFAGMLEILFKDGQRLILTALAGVTLLTLFAFGPGGALRVLAALLVGMVWLGALAGLLGLRINFMNFVALPITLGVGIDYAANLWARIDREGSARLSAILADTGSAVALCSATTIIGYSSLLLSRSRALRSFGLLADLGEIACLLAALLVIPVVTRLAPTRALKSKK